MIIYTHLTLVIFPSWSKLAKLLRLEQAKIPHFSGQIFTALFFLPKRGNNLPNHQSTSKKNLPQNREKKNLIFHQQQGSVKCCVFFARNSASSSSTTDSSVLMFLTVLPCFAAARCVTTSASLTHAWHSRPPLSANLTFFFAKFAGNFPEPVSHSTNWCHPELPVHVGWRFRGEFGLNNGYFRPEETV